MASISSLASSASLSASAVNQLMVDVSFSTTVAGKTYNANVTYSGGQYVADDSTISGAEASGSSLQAAENNLGTRIDSLV
jgi:hypothetical protein